MSGPTEEGERAGMSELRTEFDLEAQHYERRLAHLVEDLRRLADEIEREGRPRGPSIDGTPSYGRATHQVVHTFMWGAANLHLDALIDAAARTDVAAVLQRNVNEPK